MKWIIKEQVTSITEPQTTEYRVKIDALNDYGKIPMSIILSKGDMIVGQSSSAPVRLPAGAQGSVLTSNSAAAYGVQWQSMDSTAWGGIEVTNGTASTIKEGEIVKMKYVAGETTPHIEPASASDNCWLYVANADIPGSGTGSVTGASGAVTMVQLKAGESLRQGDGIAVSATDGYGENAGAYDTVAIAVGDSYADGSDNVVQAVITNRRTNRTVFKTALDSPTVDNVEYRLGEINSLSVALPDHPSADFICAFVFKSSSSWSGMTFNKTVKLTGDSLTLASRYYNVIVWWDGSVWWAKGTQAS